MIRLPKTYACIEAVKNIRIFISSPGDVAEERDRAKSVVEELRRRYAGRLDLRAVLWEDLPLQADMSFQQGIDLVLSERGVDIAVFILWSRLGSPLGAFARRPDGAEYRSGTEREWDLMWRAREHSGNERPRIIVYSRRDESSFDERLRGLPTDEKEQLVQQKKLVEQFITEEFHDATRGTNVRAYHSFDRPTTFAQRLRIHLQELLDPIAGGDLATPVWDIARQGPPFLGLDAFEGEHAAVFFGREDEIVAVRQLLREQARRGCAFVLIAGASGSGKSSLVRAGVLPSVAAHEIDNEVSGWRTAIFTPAEGGGNLLLTLAEAMTAESALPALRGQAGGVAQLAADLASDPGMVCRRVLLPGLQSVHEHERLLVFADQLEELFTDQRIAAETRDGFVLALEALARSGYVWVLATVRSDFYAQCQSLATLVRMKEGGGQFDLAAPGADALDRLIRQPAALAGLSFEQRGGASLANVIVRDATAHGELLPLLEYLLNRLCAERTPDGVLTYASYEALGGVEGALASRADAVVSKLGPSEAALDTLLAALVTLSGDEKDSVVRRRVPRTELERDKESENLVTTLIRERLLTTSAPHDGGMALVTVAHEALFRVWPVAVAWVGRNREFLRLRANVAQSFGRWQNASRDRSLLLQPGLPLEEAGRLLAIQTGRLDEGLLNYIEASRSMVRRQARTRLAMISLFTLAAGVLICVGCFRSYQRAIEQVASSNRILAQNYAARIEGRLSVITNAAGGNALSMEGGLLDTKAKLETHLKRNLERYPSVYGTCIAFQPHSYDPAQNGYAPYCYRKPDGSIEFVQLASPDYNYFQWDWYREPRDLKKPIWTEPYFDDGGGDAVMITYAVPFMRDGIVWGVSTADVSIADFMAFAQSLRVGKAGYTFVISKTGRFLAYPKRDEVMKSSLRDKDPELFRRMASGEEGFLQTREPFNGEEGWITFGPVQDGEFSVATVSLKSEVLAEALDTQKELIILGGGGIASLIVILIFISRVARSPIR